MDRLKEPSTWAGLGVLLSTVAGLVAPIFPTAGLVLGVLSGAAGGAAVKLREGRGNA